jgi:lambda family phage portal protein
MTSQVQILDARGNPMVPARPKARGLITSRVPYDAADQLGAHVKEWQPYLWSPDGQLNPYRDIITARVRDLVNNDGWASGAVTRVLDNAVGGNFRPIFKPDYRALAAHTGNKAFDAKWAYEYSKALDACYRTWANASGRWCDLQRKMTVGQMFRLAFRHKLVDGDALAMMHYRLDRVGRGGARYATSIQIIDPDRLSNPQMNWDQRHLRGGVEVDDDQVAIAYHIRKAHQGDWFSAGDAVSWDRIDRETEDGRPIIVHDYDMERANQHRGIGILAPVVQRIKMLARYDNAELDAAILNAIFGAWIESGTDPNLTADSVSAPEDALKMQGARMDYHDEADIRIAGTGGALPIMFPGDTVRQLDAKRPSGNYGPFEKAALRNVASATGLASPQLTNDWSDVSYISGRLALIEFWKTSGRRREDFASGFGQPIVRCFVEEAHEIEPLPLPRGAPEFLECVDAYSRAKFIGPGRGWYDPVNEIKGAILGMDSALMDFDEICAEQGIDGDDMIIARKHTLERFKEAGLEPPSWAQVNQGGEAQPANRTIQDPEPA